MKKVCKKCRVFVEGTKCPICGESQLSETWKGRVYLADPEKSIIAKKLKIEKSGVFAIKSK